MKCICVTSFPLLVTPPCALDCIFIEIQTADYAVSIWPPSNRCNTKNYADPISISENTQLNVTGWPNGRHINDAHARDDALSPPTHE